MTPEGWELLAFLTIMKIVKIPAIPATKGDKDEHEQFLQHFYFQNLRFDFFLFSSFLGLKPSVGADLGWVVALVGLWR